MNKKAFQVLCVLIAFFMPLYGKALPPLIALLLLNWLVEGHFRRKYEDLKKNWYIFLISPVLFYLMHLVGMTYSTNYAFGWFDMEVKLSLFVFPLLIATTPADHWNPNLKNRIFFSFIAGCLATIILFTVRAEINFLNNNDFKYLYYIYLGWYFHPSYLSMYFVFGLVILANYLVNGYKEMSLLRKSLIILLMLLFQYFVFMLSSKAGILSMFVVLMFFIFFWMFRTRKYFSGATIIVLLTGFYLLLNISFPMALERMEEAGQAVTTDSVPADAEGSSAARLNTWNTAFDVIRENFWFGVGTGDVKDELMRRYIENGNTYAQQRRLNAHSQYIQAMVVLGVPGALLLMYTIIMPGLLAIRRRDVIFISFLALVSFNMLVESVLETQAGVVFFAFFLTMFLAKQDLED